MFTTELFAKRGKPRYWILTEPLGWSDKEFGTIIVPKGFESNLANIPWYLTVFEVFDRNGISRRPAVLHDYLYTIKKTTRDFADRLLRAAMIAEGAPQSVAWAYYRGVNLFGAEEWRS